MAIVGRQTQKQGILTYGGVRNRTFWDEPAIDSNGQPAAPGIWTDLPTKDAPLPDRISPWDVIYLNDVRAPGVARVSGGRHIPYDRKAALGVLVGQASLFNFDPVEITLTLRLWHPDQWNELEDLLPWILPSPGPNPDPRAVRVSYPSLAVLGVETIYFQGMDLPQESAPGVMDFVFYAYEWLPPLP